MIEEIMDFIKKLDDKEIEIFIRVAKEENCVIDDEDKLRKILKDIRNNK
jgi:hypothetical protein